MNNRTDSFYELSWSWVLNNISTIDNTGCNKTVSGGTLTAWSKGKDIYLTDENGNSAKVTIADVNQSNGVIHVIDAVVTPKS
jgi:uncharacterized surface protein with fasciclin (FAS1) repeats